MLSNILLGIMKFEYLLSTQAGLYVKLRLLYIRHHPFYAFRRQTP